MGFSDFFTIQRRTSEMIELPRAVRSEKETILLLYSGGARFRNLAGEGALSSEMAAIIHANQPWFLILEQESAAWEISFLWEFLSDLFPPDFRNRHEGVTSIEDVVFRYLVEIVEMMELETKRTSPNIRYVRFLLAALLEQIHSQLFPNKDVERFQGSGRMDDFHRLLEVIERHYMEPYPITFYAQELGITTKRLNALCQNVVGKPCSSLVENRRMTQAKNLLIGTQIPISEISESVGYADQGYFSRVFHKKYGMTPSAYRESNQSLKILAK